MAKIPIVRTRRGQNRPVKIGPLPNASNAGQTPNERPHTTGKGIFEAEKRGNYYGKGVTSASAKSMTGKTRTWKGK